MGDPIDWTVHVAVYTDTGRMLGAYDTIHVPSVGDRVIVQGDPREWQVITRCWQPPDTGSVSWQRRERGGIVDMIVREVPVDEKEAPGG
jgi:hypothetical protein